MTVAIFYFLIWTGPAVPTDAKPAEPAYRFQLDKAGDALTVKTEAKRTLFVLTSKSGIGSGVITLTAGQWPTNVVLRFQYEDGQGFSNLEAIRLTTDRLHVEGSLSESRKMRFYFLTAAGEPQPDAAPAAGNLDVAVEARDGALEVTLPANLLVGSTKLKLTWIDVFR